MKGATAAAKSLQSCPTLCDPIDCSSPGSSVPGIPQARTLEWVAISFSNAWKWKVKVKSLSCVRPSATPWTTAFQGPPSMGFSRQEYWSGSPLPPLNSTLNIENKDTLSITPPFLLRSQRLDVSEECSVAHFEKDTQTSKEFGSRSWFITYALIWYFIRLEVWIVFGMEMKASDELDETICLKVISTNTPSKIALKLRVYEKSATLNFCLSQLSS